MSHLPIPQEGQQAPQPFADEPIATTVQDGAAPATSAAPPQSGGMQSMLFMFAILFGVMWLFVLRPERKRQKARETMLSAVAKNDTVVTTGGVIGTVSRLEDKTVTIKVDDNVRIKFDRNAIARIASSSGEEATAKS